jgi:maltooligosyltrehalose trehalohydrolase
MKIGTDYKGNGRCEFVVWAPLLKSVSLKLVSWSERIIPMEMADKGYWKVVADGVLPGALYLYRLDNKLEMSDPASRFQPEGVHGPSQVIDPWVTD